MKILFWNCRGFGNPRTKSVFKNLCLLNKPDFAFLAEPWIDISAVSVSHWRQLNLKVFCLNDRNEHIPNLWGLCSIHLNPTFLSVSSQHWSFSICSDTQMVFISVVYASTNYQLRRQLWSDLNGIQVNNPSPWCLVGDFNSVLGSHEVRSSSLPLRIACDELRLSLMLGSGFTCKQEVHPSHGVMAEEVLLLQRRDQKEVCVMRHGWIIRALLFAAPW